MEFVRNGTDAVLITTDEIEVVVHRSPLLIEFRDAKTHSLINADEQPMAYDAKGLLKEMMFDPQAPELSSRQQRRLVLTNTSTDWEKRQRGSISVAVRL